LDAPRTDPVVKEYFARSARVPSPSCRGQKPALVLAVTTRKEIFEAAAKLRAEFDELAQVPHNGARGSAAEDLISSFLNAHLPKRFVASGGFVLNRNDNVSSQTDVIIYDAFNCPVYRASDKDGIFPADNVAAVIEVKSRLTTDFEDGFKEIAGIKSLTKTNTRNSVPGQLLQTMGCILAFKSDLSLDTPLCQYRDLIRPTTSASIQI
jgi:hypothetical protein